VQHRRDEPADEAKAQRIEQRARRGGVGREESRWTGFRRLDT
jgi:hypothetical protein